MVRQFIDIPFNGDKSDVEVLECFTRTEFSVEWHFDQFFIMFLEVVVSVCVDYIFLLEKGCDVFQECWGGLFGGHVVALSVADVEEVLKGVPNECFA